MISTADLYATSRKLFSFTGKIRLCMAVLLTAGCFSTGFSQNTDSLSIDRMLNTVFTADSTIRLFILGEDHTQNNAEHKLKIIRLLYEQYGFRKIAMEYPRSVEPQMNAYISGKTSEPGATLENVNSMNPEDLIVLLKGIRAMNRTFAAADPLQIFCFDVDAEANKYALNGVKRFLENYDQKKVQTLNILASQKVKTNDEASAVFARIISELRTKEDYYTTVFTENDRLLLDDIIEGFELISSNGKISIVNDSLLAARELFLVKMMDRQLQQHPAEKLIVFTGQEHASSLNPDPYGMPFTMTHELKRRYTGITSFYSIYYNRKKSFADHFFAEYIDLLDEGSVRAFVENPGLDYLVLPKDQLTASPELYSRCDGVLIKNCKGQKR